ncbi:MAG: hypothetical protein NTZ68_04170 [Candidatus Dependentiae bacterium]|nr:hypothetical protein [Candidatus Dependentiae bacterium]
MIQNDKNMISEQEEKDTVFSPEDDLQIVMQGGLPVSVIVPMEEFDRMAITIEIAQELLEGKELSLEDGTKVTFQEMIDQRVAADRAEYEADLASMLEEDDCDGEECDEDCGDECDEEEQD